MSSSESRSEPSPSASGGVAARATPRRITTDSRVTTVFSLWAWLALTPFFLTTFAGLDHATDLREAGVALITALIVHAALAVAFVMLGWIDIALAPRPVVRWIYAGAAFVALAVLRPLALTGLHEAFDLHVIDLQFPARFLTNLMVIPTTCLLVHRLGDASRRTSEANARLRGIIERLDDDALRIESRRERILASFRDDISVPVFDAIGGLMSRDLPAEQLARELRWIADSVVRHASSMATHAELETALDEDAIRQEPVTRPPEPPKPRERGRIAPTFSLGGAVKTAPAWMVTAVTMLLLTPSHLASHRSGVGVVLFFVGALIAYLGCILITRLPLAQRGTTALATIALAYLGLGAIVCLVMASTLPPELLNMYYLTWGTLTFGLVGLIISFIASAYEQLRRLELETSLAIIAADEHVFRARRVLRTTAERASVALGTGVQSELVATSLLLQEGQGGPDVLETLLDRVTKVMDRTSIELDDDETCVPTTAQALRDGVRTALTAWTSILDLQVDFADDALHWIAARPEAAMAVHDALVEGLSNVVRHGVTLTARVTLRTLTDGVDGVDGVEALVANPGRLQAKEGKGLGLSEVDLRAHSVTLAQEHDEVVLRVVVT